MNKEIKDCPFCGGEAELDVNCIEIGWHVGCVMCKNCFAMLNSTSGDTVEEAEHNAIKLWNARAERTCVYEYVSNIPIGNGLVLNSTGFACNHCGRGVMDKPQVGTFCMGCGAKVIDNVF